jgi:hypothetical protein
MQELLSSIGKKETKLDELYRHRMVYYNDMMKKIRLINNRKRDIIKTFNLTIKELDREIENEIKRYKRCKSKK